MRHYLLHRPATLLLLIPLLYSPVASAEIYKWVDAQGNVHFGDKPQDPSQATGAKPVELKESYRPTERTAEQQEAYDRAREAERRRVDKQRREQLAKQEETQEKRNEEKAARCEYYETNIKRLGSINVDERGRYFYAATENGEVVTEDRQTEIVAELKAKQAKDGCI